MCIDKIIEERFPRYFVFGSPKGGKVDVASTHHNCIASVTPEEAELIISERDAIVDTLVRFAQGESFDSIIYGIED